MNRRVTDVCGATRPGPRAALSSVRTTVVPTAIDRLARLTEATAAAVTERDAADARLSEVSTRLELLHTELTRAQTDRATKQRTLQDAQSALTAARARAEDVRRILAERQARLATLREMQQAGEGLYQGVRATLNAARSGEIKGAYRPVVDLLRVPEELRIAVEVALGGAAQDIVCDTEDEAKHAIDWLKGNRAGRATFLALPLLRPPRPIPATSIAGMPGIVGVASDLVSFDARYAPAVQLLLGRTVVACDMGSAI